MRRGLALIVFLFSIALAGAENESILDIQNESILTSPIECFPNYLCDDWSECIGGVEARICKDSACNRKNIIERRFCDQSGGKCSPEINCDDWSECIYTEKTEDIIQGKVTFGGYQTRNCVDYNECTDTFTEERICGDSYDLELRVVQVCGVNYLIASDFGSNRQVAKVDLDSWKEKKLNIIFTEGESRYCPSCFNGLRDGNEAEIDCGGSCKSCKEEKKYPIGPVRMFLWIFSVIFIVLSGIDIYKMQKEDLNEKKWFRK